MIKLTAIGNLGKDAIINTVNGKSVMNFNVAHTEKFKDSRGIENSKTTWMECAYWSDSKVGQYLKKGTLVYIEGQPEVRTYTKNDGSTGTSLAVRITSVQLLGGGQRSQNENVQGNVNSNETVNTSSDISEPVDDLPF